MECTAPGKVILFGEHFVVHGTGAILCAIDRHVRVSAAGRSDSVLRIKSDIITGEYHTDSDAPADTTVRPFLHIARRCGGADIAIESNLESGAGLGSSSACLVAAAAAVCGAGADRREILQLALSAERTVHPRSSGADCYVCTHGGACLYADSPSPVDIPAAMILVIAYSGIPHSTSDMVRQVGETACKRPEAFARMRAEAADIVRLGAGALRRGDMIQVGLLASRNQKLLESVGVSNDTLRSMVDTASRHSYGAKITGAGGGGCIVAIADESNAYSTMQALESAGYGAFAARVDQRGVRASQAPPTI